MAANCVGHSGHPRSRPGCVALTCMLLGLAVPPRIQAQALGLRLGAGPAYAGSGGATALAALELGRGSALARVEARGIATGRSGDWEESARVVALGLAAGLAGHAAAGARGYLLATAAGGIDPREADHVASLGAALGSELGHSRLLFAELRYERWLQRGVRHYDLPANAFSLIFGLTVR